MRNPRGLLADGQPLKTLVLSPREMKRDILAYAHSLGFARVGVTSADPLKEAGDYLAAWIGEGRAGEMDYLVRNAPTRARPGEALPGARSVVALAMSYFHPVDGSPPVEKVNLAQGRVAKYAWGREYHGILRKRLQSLVRYIESLVPEARCKTFVDTGPLLERALAQRAGLGFTGKNTMLITRGLGSWVFLALVVTNLDLPVDETDTRTCGSCTLCLDACPTQAITAPYQLDARRCIAYLTIELKTSISDELRTRTGDWVFGCDVCQDVCPHNTHIPRTAVPEMDPSQGVGRALDLAEILKIRTDTDFDKHFAGTPIKRSQRHGLIRNACLVAANSDRKDLIPLLKTLAESDTHPVVREHARWAYHQLTTK
jgi:epoxyqueuosine reductase